MEIAIALDSYDDIFSDFDIRSYRERAISKDFLDELRVRLRRLGTKSSVDIVLLVPARDRSVSDEELIAARARSFFDERREHYLREDARSKLGSVVFVSVGLVLSLAASYFAGRLAFLPLFKDFLLIPAWFFVWSGLERFVKDREEIGRKKKYYLSLCGSRIVFGDREAYEGGAAR
jgi:hypothetical protein